MIFEIFSVMPHNIAKWWSVLKSSVSFFGSRPDIFESFVTSQNTKRIIMSIGFVINQFYQLWLFVSLKSLCQIREDWKQRRLADDCVHKISFWSRNVVTRQWRKPIREELTTYLNFPDHTGWEARRRMRRDRDREGEERVILTPVEEEEDIENNVIWGHQQGGGTAATLTTKIWKRY